VERIIIEGGERLTGTVAVSGAKNAALPMLAAALLSDEPVRLRNVPNLQDIVSMKKLLEQLGALVESDEDQVTVTARSLAQHEASYDLVRKMRASVLVLGPMVARLRRARVSLPGGCAIGARPIDLHLTGLERLGATNTLTQGYVDVEADHLTGSVINFDTVTVTGTENVIMAATLARGTTVLQNAAREPEVTALAEMLNAMGARITGAGTAIVTIEGVESLGGATVDVIADRIETGTYMVAAALTQGDVALTRCRPDHLDAVIDKLRLTGTSVDVDDDRIRVRGPKEITSVDITTMPYPGFPTDMQAQFMVLMSLAMGSSLIAETIFENRMIHVGELQRMGADITVTNNQAVVRGVAKLSGAPVMASDLRASASLILAGLMAEGTTLVRRIYHLDRGYECLDTKLAMLGAHIRREPDVSDDGP